MLYARWHTLASIRGRSPLRWMARLYRRLWNTLHRRAAHPLPGRVRVRSRFQNALTPWRMNSLGAAGAGLAFTLALAGCGPTGAYVAADRATYDAVAPEYAAYVTADTGLTPEQRLRRHRTLQTWKLRLDAAQSTPATRPALSN